MATSRAAVQDPELDELAMKYRDYAQNRPWVDQQGDCWRITGRTGINWWDPCRKPKGKHKPFYWLLLNNWFLTNNEFRVVKSILFWLLCVLAVPLFGTSWGSLPRATGKILSCADAGKIIDWLEAVKGICFIGWRELWAYCVHRSFGMDGGNMVAIYWNEMGLRGALLVGNPT